MICPKCNSDNTICKNSRANGTYRRRRYQCHNCNNAFSTKEVWHDYNAEKAENSAKPIVKRLEILYNLSEGADVCVSRMLIYYAIINLLYIQQKLAESREKEKEVSTLAEEAMRCINETYDALSLQKYTSAILCMDVFRRTHKKKGNR